MKRNILVFFCCSVTLSVSAQSESGLCDNPELLKSFYELNPNGFLGLDSIGVVSFASDREWIITGNGIVQIWSDAVQATACNKSHFMGNRSTQTFSVLLSDCRTNPDHPGDLFSWCIVNRFAGRLCPYPWRIPTYEDFCTLNRILFNTSACFTHNVTPEQIQEKFLNQWGGALAGGSSSMGSGIHHSGVKAYYWSQTVYDESHAYYLDFDVHGKVQPRCNANAKNVGFSLRCIR